MSIGLVVFAKASFGRAIAIAISWAKGGFAKWRAGKRAMRGDDLTKDGSLKYLIKSELSTLVVSAKLPKELQNDGFSAWMLTDDCIEQFCEALISKTGGEAALTQRACEELARRYELAMGETSRLASGPINLVVSYVYGQLRATESSKEAFNNALTQRISAQVHALRHPEPIPFPIGADIKRFQRLSAKLLAAGCASWRMPEFVAPLTLEAHEEKGDKDPHPITTAQLASAIESGDSVVLFGEGGIGKTTFLLDLASQLSREPRGRTPLYIDAAMWARSGATVLDHISRHPSAQALDVTSGELAKLAECGRLILIVNGWNEIPAAQKASCRETFNHLTTAAPALAVVVASRTAHDVPNLSSARRIAVRGLTWQGQKAVIRSELSEKEAHSLLEVLAKDNQLRHAARSPLILRGLISQSLLGAVASVNVFDLLGAVVATFGQDNQRGLILAESPVFGMQEHYLEELACRLNARGATDLTRVEALAAVAAAARTMLNKDQPDAIPAQPMTILEVLASHHVLHIQDNLVRFAHHRFQEYFAAARILRTIGAADEPLELLRDAVNQPAWDESLELVAGKLRVPGGSAVARARLVQAAEAVDVAYACDLAGLCAFNETDDAELHRRLVERVNELKSSRLPEVQDLGTACQIASCLPEFADQLWVLLESDERETRLRSHRLNGLRITLAQLGPAAETRINAWLPARRAELIHEIADNPDNYDFIARTAVATPDQEVRAAAISALFWNFPASTVAIKAWLDAPLEVQTAHELVNYVAYTLEQGVVGGEVRDQLCVIAAGDISDQLRLQLALAFPDEMGPYAVDVVLARLQSEERYGDPEPLLSIVRANAPDRLRALAIELVVSPRVPRWVGTVLSGEAPDVCERAFDSAWDCLEIGKTQRLSPEVVGPLSNSWQTERSVTAWMRVCLERRNNLTHAEQERGREIGYLLAHAPGNDLLNVVMKFSFDASYEQSIVMVDLLLTRVSRDEGRVPRENPWLLTPEQFNQLFSLFSSKSEQDRNVQDKLFTLLASIASYVAPAEFGPLLLEALRRQLDAWSAYWALLDEWVKNPSTPRPHNPPLGLYVISALSRWGIDALPGVLELIDHPNASDLVPEAIGQIAGLPWATSKVRIDSSVNTDIQDGNQRRQAGRILQQPTEAVQSATDEAARAIAKLLSVEVDVQRIERITNPNWNVKQAEHRIGKLVAILANLPSSEVVVPVTRALGSGLVEMYGFIESLRSLIRQGWLFSDPIVVSQFEALYELETRASWFPDSNRYTFSTFSQLMFMVEPTSLLKLPLSHYLTQWQRFAHPSEIIRILGDMKSEQSFPQLVTLTKELAAKGQIPDDVAYSVVSTLSTKHFSAFARLVTDGTLFTWCGNVWTVERIAPAVALVVQHVPDSLTMLIASCRNNASPMADALLGKVLAEVDGQDKERLDFGLDALDAGRANTTNQPAYEMLKGMFTLTVPTGTNQFEIHPQACNSLRQELYRRARTGGAAAIPARRLLAAVECERREAGRPADEPRHPEVTDGLTWTNVLYPDDSSLSRQVAESSTKFS